MMLLRSSASFLVRSTRNGTPMSILNAQRRGGAVSARALSSSFHRGRSVFAAVDLGGGVVTRLDKARDVFGDKQQKKSWDYVAHHPCYEMVKSEFVQEYGAKVTLYRHRQTQTEVMSVSVDDENKEESPEDRQRWRDEILSTSSKDFEEFAERLQGLKARATTAVVGSKKALEDANAKLGKDAGLEVIELLIDLARVIIPTRGQADLDASGTVEDGGGGRGGGRGRSEPSTLEEAGPVQVLYCGHDLLIIDKALHLPQSRARVRHNHQMPEAAFAQHLRPGFQPVHCQDQTGQYVAFDASTGGREVEHVQQTPKIQGVEGGDLEQILIPCPQRFEREEQPGLLHGALRIIGSALSTSQKASGVMADGRKAGMWRPVPVFILLLVLPVVVCAFVSPARVPSSCTLPSSSIITATCLAPSLIHRPATSEDDPPPPPTTLVDKLFSLFFGAKEAKPLGFARISVESSPEVYPATTSIFADPLPGDSRDVAALRPLLAQTRLEKAPLNLIYDAVRDGWKKGDFHRKVDNRGATLVVARTRGGAVCGGYNPEGWEGVGDERQCISAFLFTWPQGKMRASRPIKCPKVGGASYAVDDNPALAVKFGYEDFFLKLTTDRKAISKLGLAYAKLPGGATSLFAPSEGKMAEIVDLKVYARKGR
ncbi:hypothetical protein NSK_005124 [Nannochloropsis salina CCMP1776]|uniref:TLDc domain-containing protein n=1 Tax=Nannochloropsis salina CCMP1776 TaxID=1027361 RepID=A0A4D9D624_9STRA|nr:hypothetical protein NSK_005124 [Nannochloropsis salina CCMP1776]|eukprot:TFJ84029.1 hypothetical protein NSK_005124 [Nannochloropsis salina CCMP1776]